MKKPTALPASLAAVAQQVGAVVAHSGFDPLAGEVWTALFLTPDPLDEKAIAKALKASPKKVAVALAEMVRWGAVTRQSHAAANGIKELPLGRRAPAAAPLYGAEVNPLKIAIRVLREREMPGIEELLARLRRAQDDRALDAFARDRLRLLGEILGVLGRLARFRG
jgi:hypothetical protein